MNNATTLIIGALFSIPVGLLVNHLHEIRQDELREEVNSNRLEYERQLESLRQANENRIKLIEMAAHNNSEELYRQSEFGKQERIDKDLIHLESLRQYIFNLEPVELFLLANGLNKEVDFIPRLSFSYNSPSDDDIAKAVVKHCERTGRPMTFLIHFKDISFYRLSDEFRETFINATADMYSECYHKLEVLTDRNYRETASWWHESFLILSGYKNWVGIHWEFIAQDSYERIVVSAQNIVDQINREMKKL